MCPRWLYDRLGDRAPVRPVTNMSPTASSFPTAKNSVKKKTHKKKKTFSNHVSDEREIPLFPFSNTASTRTTVSSPERWSGCRRSYKAEVFLSALSVVRETIFKTKHTKKGCFFVVVFLNTAPPIRSRACEAKRREGGGIHSVSVLQPVLLVLTQQFG